MTRSRAAILFLLFLVALVRMPEAQSQDSALSVTAKPGAWRYLNADPQSTRYSPLDQINNDNSRI